MLFYFYVILFYVILFCFGFIYFILLYFTTFCSVTRGLPRSEDRLYVCCSRKTSLTCACNDADDDNKTVWPITRCMQSDDFRIDLTGECVSQVSRRCVIYPA